MFTFNYINIFRFRQAHQRYGPNQIAIKVKRVFVGIRFIGLQRYTHRRNKLLERLPVLYRYGFYKIQIIPYIRVSPAYSPEAYMSLPAVCRGKKRLGQIPVSTISRCLDRKGISVIMIIGDRQDTETFS